ncbi:MAG: hypothetical protein ACKO39_03370, partial [Chthoniobacterales bacterium]
MKAAGKSSAEQNRGGLWERPLAEVAEIAPARLKALASEGIVSTADLLRHYPRRHEDRTKFP